MRRRSAPRVTGGARPSGASRATDPSPCSTRAARRPTSLATPTTSSRTACTGATGTASRPGGTASPFGVAGGATTPSATARWSPFGARRLRTGAGRPSARARRTAAYAAATGRPFRVGGAAPSGWCPPLRACLATPRRPLGRPTSGRAARPTSRVARATASGGPPARGVTGTRGGRPSSRGCPRPTGPRRGTACVAPADEPDTPICRGLLTCASVFPDPAWSISLSGIIATASGGTHGPAVGAARPARRSCRSMVGVAPSATASVTSSSVSGRSSAKGTDSRALI